MARVKVLRPFNLQCENGTSVQLHAGGEYVPDQFASHPLVLAHTEPYEAVQSVAVEKPSLTTDDLSDEPIKETPAEHDGREALILQASVLGITIDRRWGLSRLRAVIDSAKSQ